ncbi:hypothetical protein [Vibrio neptunius]|uniref:hypothetical protein n=1 Tax=Vibrio neptunius TaxID=170651 RepID=UPI0019D10D1F|nr:hypothetical protein [Vibrio neptunius]MBN3572339.1 hypothetical protein [Vibrio neptunius]QXX08477.1 hypothetical protein KW548_22945 [Vibrio neptunius]
MKEVALITLHGMGKVKLDYYDELEKALKKELGSEWVKVSFHNVQYAPILQQPQDDLWKAMMSEPSNDLHATRLRQFFLYGFGDAGSLEHSSHRRKDKYLAVQEEIFKTLEYAYADIGENENRPVIIIAQSLGCQVISNYLWDAEHGLNMFENYVDSENKESFMKLKTCENLITTGCNIPLFNAGLQERHCFTKPHPSFRWDNYYDPDDVLGWPLRQLDDSYHAIVDDHPINAGSLIASWNPFSHGQYWSDKDVIKPLVSIIRSKLS